MARGLSVPIGADITGLQKGLSASTAAVAGWGAVTGTSLTRTLGTITTAFAGAGLAATAFGVTAIRSFADLDSAARNTAGIIIGATEETVTAITDDLVDLALKYSHSLDDIGMGYYQAISGSIPQEKTKEFLDLASQVAIAGVTTVESATEAMLTATIGIGASVEDWPRIANLMLGAVREGRITMTELAATMSDYVVVGDMLNIGLDEQLAAQATITRLTGNAHESATQMKAMWFEFMKEGTQASRAFHHATGQTLKEFMDEGGDFIDALVILEEHAESYGVTIFDIFANKRSALGAANLLQDTEGYRDDLKKLREDETALAEALDIQTSGVQYQLDRLSSGWKVLTARMGQFFEPLMQVVLPGLMDKLTGAIEWAESLVDPWAGLDESVSDVQKDMEFGEPLSKAQKFSKKILEYWQTFSKTVSDLWGDITNLAKKIWDLVDGPLSMVGRFIRDNWRPFVGLVISAAHYVIELGKRIAAWVTEKLEPFKKWKEETWDPWIEKLQEKNAFTLDFTVDKVALARIAGIGLAMVGMKRGSIPLITAGLALAGAAVLYSAYKDEPWLKDFMERNIEPTTEAIKEWWRTVSGEDSRQRIKEDLLSGVTETFNTLKTIAGYGLIVYGTITKNKDHISKGMEWAGYSFTTPEEEDDWIDSFIEDSTEWVNNLKTFVSRLLMIFGIFTFNLPVMVAAVALASDWTFDPNTDNKEEFKTRSDQLSEDIKGALKGLGILIMIFSIFKGRWALATTGAAMYFAADKAVDFTTDPEGNWATEAADTLWTDLSKMMKIAGYAMFIVGAAKLNWKLITQGWLLVEGSEYTDDPMAWNMDEAERRLKGMAGLGLISYGMLSGKWALVAAGVILASAYLQPGEHRPEDIPSPAEIEEMRRQGEAGNKQMAELAQYWTDYLSKNHPSAGWSEEEAKLIEEAYGVTVDPSDGSHVSDASFIAAWNILSRLGLTPLRRSPTTTDSWGEDPTGGGGSQPPTHEGPPTTGGVPEPEGWDTVTPSRTPPIARYAKGGYISRPTLALMGEGGEGEWVIPESKMNNMGNTYNININTSGWGYSDEQALLSTMARLRRQQGRERAVEAIGAR